MKRGLSHEREELEWEGLLKQDIQENVWKTQGENYNKEIQLEFNWKRNAYEVLVGKAERKRPLRRTRVLWDDNIKVDLM